jgi:hypothetical protein
MGPSTFELGFAKFIERFHEQIKENFLEDAFNKREMLSRHQLGRRVLEDLADSVVSEFTKNIDRRTTIETIADEYVQLGIKCCGERLSYSEMVRVFTLLKRHIWLFFQENNFAGQPFDVRSIVALNNRMALFFDRAVYYFLVGYEQAGSEDKSELETLYRTVLDRIRRDLALPVRPEKDE